MPTTHRDAALRAWVEELAMLFEKDGLPRMAGRIFGWLLVCQPAEQTMDQLAAALQGSKASMSTMTRLLEQAGLVVRVRPPGARRDHFRAPQGEWERLWRSRLEFLHHVCRHVARGLDLLGPSPAGARDRLADLHDQYRFFERELPALVERWARTRHEKPASPRAPRAATRTSRRRSLDRA